MQKTHKKRINVKEGDVISRMPKNEVPQLRNKN